MPAHKLTSGEWFYEGIEKGGRVISNDDRQTIVHIPSGCPENSQCIGDAMLIAQAKRMKNILIDLVYFIRAASLGESIDWNKVDKEAGTRARKILEDATGSTF